MSLSKIRFGSEAENDLCAMAEALGLKNPEQPLINDHAMELIRLGLGLVKWTIKMTRGGRRIIACSSNQISGEIAVPEIPFLSVIVPDEISTMLLQTVRAEYIPIWWRDKNVFNGSSPADMWYDETSNDGRGIVRAAVCRLKSGEPRD